LDVLPTMNDQDPLALLLKKWRLQPGEVPDFNRSVWARLQAKPATEDSSLPGRLLPFPLASTRWAMSVAASLLVLLSLAAGSGAAFAYESINRDERMASAYARTIDPLQMTSSHAHR